MKIKTPDVRLGEAIEKRLWELHLTKAELGRRIGVARQNVQNILSKGSIESDLLLKISEALEFNFFSLFCEVDEGDITMAIGNHAKALNRNHINMNDSTTLRLENEHLRERLADKEERIGELKERIEELKGRLK